MAADFAGEVSAKEAFAVLQQNRAAVLVDVRTSAEWSYVGAPDLSGLGKQVLFVEWQSFPSMAVNSNFAADLGRKLEAANTPKSSPVIFICRSGARSRSAAIELTKAGYTNCLNLVGGFEGDRDPKGHRNTVNGWRVSGLPWTQS
jgi:rhodanese-related sulfurtransferase